MRLGEFWIDETGFATFADGNIGDFNHEGLALQTIRCRILNSIGADFDDSICDDDFYTNLIQKELELEEEPSVWTAEKAILKRLEEDKDPEYELIKRLVNSKDPRETVINEFGWIWVKGNWAGFKEINQESLKRLSQGFQEIVNDEEDVEGIEVTLRVFNENKEYSISLNDILNGNFESLLISKVDPALEAKSDYAARQARENESLVYRGKHSE